MILSSGSEENKINSLVKLIFFFNNHVSCSTSNNTAVFISNYLDYSIENDTSACISTFPECFGGK